MNESAATARKSGISAKDEDVSLDPRQHRDEKRRAKIESPPAAKKQNGAGGDDFITLVRNLPPELLPKVLAFRSTEFLMRFLIESFYSSSSELRSSSDDIKKRHQFLASIKATLLARKEAMGKELLARNEVKLVQFMEGIFDGLLKVENDQSKDFFSASKKCCVMLTYVEIALSNRTADDHLLWPAGIGDITAGGWVGQGADTRQIPIRSKVLLSTPLPWSPPIIFQLDQWMKRGQSDDLFLGEGVPETATRYIGLATEIQSYGNMTRVDGSRGPSRFAYIDSELGGDGMCPDLRIGNESLKLITDDFATADHLYGGGRNFYELLDESEYPWLSQEKVKGKNMFISWGWRNSEFHDEGPSDGDAVFGILEEIVIWCRTRLRGNAAFHK